MLHPIKDALRDIGDASGAARLDRACQRGHWRRAPAHRARTVLAVDQLSGLRRHLRPLPPQRRRHEHYTAYVASACWSGCSSWRPSPAASPCSSRGELHQGNAAADLGLCHAADDAARDPLRLCACGAAGILLFSDLLPQPRGSPRCWRSFCSWRRRRPPRSCCAFRRIFPTASFRLEPDAPRHVPDAGLLGPRTAGPAGASRAPSTTGTPSPISSTSSGIPILSGELPANALGCAICLCRGGAVAHCPISVLGRHTARNIVRSLNPHGIDSRQNLSLVYRLRAELTLARRATGGRRPPIVARIKAMARARYVRRSTASASSSRPATGSALSAPTARARPRCSRCSTASTSRPAAASRSRAGSMRCSTSISASAAKPPAAATSCCAA